MPSIDNSSTWIQIIYSSLERNFPLTEEKIQKVINGDGVIFYEIGEMYHEQEDYYVARLCYRIAAERNNSQAQCQIGSMYFFGEGIDVDYKLAGDWFIKAMKNNKDNDTPFYIGRLYEEGFGVPRNINNAIAWYQMAADRGVSLALSYLGLIYEYEEEFKDLKKAVEVYKKAHDRGQKVDIGLKRLNEQGYFSKDEEHIEQDLKTSNDEKPTVSTTEKTTKPINDFQLEMEKTKIEKEDLQKRLDILLLDVFEKDIKLKSSLAILKRERNEKKELQEKLDETEENAIKKEIDLYERIEKVEQDKQGQETLLKQVLTALEQQINSRW